MRRALVIGIDHYDKFPALRCAVNDATRLEKLLSRNDDGSLNYTVKLQVSGPGNPPITRTHIRKLWLELFDEFCGDILFYFSGHGVQTPWGGCLVTQDGTRDEFGISMEDLLLLANKSRARDIVLILDCCHSGDLGNPPILQSLQQPLSLLREGVTVLAASRPNQVSYEVGNHGLFSDAIAEGLDGGAADHMGNVNAASLYLYAEKLFGAWDQRPIYKSYTGTVSQIRLCNPPLPPEVMRTIVTFFPDPKGRVKLDPEYESEPDPSETNPIREKKRKDSRLFKQLRDARYLETVQGSDLYWAAMNSEEIRLTNLGRYYWRLLQRGSI